MVIGDLLEHSHILIRFPLPQAGTECANSRPLYFSERLKQFAAVEFLLLLTRVRREEYTIFSKFR